MRKTLGDYMRLIAEFEMKTIFGGFMMRIGNKEKPEEVELEIAKFRAAFESRKKVVDRQLRRDLSVRLTAQLEKKDTLTPLSDEAGALVSALERWMADPKI